MTRRVAIACQGGGSHTAFTAGALPRLLDATGYEVVGISGTSGGAICALLGWYGRVHDDHTPADLLRDFWAEVAATEPVDRMTNDWTRLVTGLRRAGVPMPELSPYWLPSSWGQRRIRDTLERHVDFARARELAGTTDLGLFVSAVEVLTGEFAVFREEEVTPEVLLASTAEPSLFTAVEIDDSTYWDGLFSKNPPIHDFTVAPDVPDPDEVWIVKINPQERDRVPKSLDGILDRRNELAGNLSLNAEIRFIDQVNRWIEQGYLPDRYTRTEVRRIRFPRNLDWTTKLDRDPQFIERLVRDGRERAEAFLAER